MNKIEKITGVILAGGKSTRMGTDKCLSKHNGRYLTDYVIDAVKPITENIIISTEKKAHKRFGYKTISDEIINCGPIGGIYTALKTETADIFIFSPCDTPFVTTELYRFLLNEKKEYDAVVPVFNGKIEPLISVLSSRVLSVVQNNIKTKQYKIVLLFNLIKTKFIDIHPGLPFYSENLFANINYKADLSQL